MPATNNRIFAFSNDNGKTRVSVAAPHNVTVGSYINILKADKYLGSFLVIGIASSTFTIDFNYAGDETAGFVPRWQIKRERPVFIDTAGESIDTLRQGVNQVSGDFGNIDELDPGDLLAAKRNLVEAMNSFLEGTLQPNTITTEMIQDGAVTTEKLHDQAVTSDKLNLVWVDYPFLFSDFVETFNGMTLTSVTTHAAKMMFNGNQVKVKLDFSCVFGGVMNNIVRYKVPSGSLLDEIVPANITIQTAFLTENGVQTWGGREYCDIQRPGGINYTPNTEWRFKVRFEYDIA